ncbi:peptide chain release factor N(5)-glutamine methyltransferase [Bosea sp. TAB14]|uniref:peptide chain release factor N(5)-glutamine methyltransferase n=1 Tax=Bosea sp. TAB14 TaxID=3237481 RepID=UPI003F8EC5A5
MLTVREARRLVVRALRHAGIEPAGLEARLLLEGALETRHLDPDRSLDPSTAAVLAGFLHRRLAGEPVWRVLGEREFWGLTFRLSPATLEPRPDSETIVEAALDRLGGRRDETLSILDLGTGTGCLLVALLSECRNATGLGIDLSAEACETAAGNAARNGVAGRVSFRQGRWTEGLSGPFDLIVSNPPYIPSSDIATLAVEVREHDPRLALDGGPDGLDPYRCFARSLPALLAPGGFIVLEIGAGQKQDIASIMAGGGLELQASRYDLGGHERALIFAPA